MQPFSKATLTDIELELNTLFSAHEAVGLNGKMCLYTLPEQRIWRAEKGGVQFWFGRDQIPQAIEVIVNHYNNGSLPNSPMLLNPIVHAKDDSGAVKALGSGIMWATGFALGVAQLSNDSAERLNGSGVLATPFHRGDNERAGLKMVAFSKEVLPVEEGGWTVKGCKALYNLSHIDSPDYQSFYLLSGLNYLCTHGLFGHPSFADLVPAGAGSSVEDVKKLQINPQAALDASIAWDAYDKHHSLYKKFGTDVSQIDNNLKFYRMVAHDIGLFDATGVKHMDAKTEVGFDFLVDGWIPKGAITVIGATGGTGKSSLAHNLAVKASTDYEPGEEVPTWLNSRIATENADGIVIYLSGEDGPQIVHARAKVFDPKGRSHRLMCMRTDFGDGVNLAGFLKRLRQLPNVSLLVIDPARKYLTGDENDAGVVSEFFEAIEEFAINMNAAVVVVHHLAKGAHPTHVSEIYDLLRGSQVFIDRPRVVIGMYREGPHVVAGLAKNNIPPQLGMIQGERVFARDADRLELVQLPGKDGVRLDGMTSEELEEMLAEKKAAKK